MRLGRGIRHVLCGVLSAALLALATSSPAAADTLLVQPDGKIVLAGKTYPEFGALARLQPNGTLDPGFGKGGFAIDQRTGNFTALASQPDGRIVAAPVGGAMLARYFADGAVDPSFGTDGLGSTGEAARFDYGTIRPSALLVRPDGSLVVGANAVLGGGSVEAWIKRYDDAGSPIETVGRVPRLGGAADASSLNDLFESPAGPLFGVGSTYETRKIETRAFLARFLPGSGTDFDPGFGGGAGLVRPDLLSKPRFLPSFNAVAEAGGKLLAAGRTAGTFLLARFDQEGNLDPSFGASGFAAPPILGPGNGGEEADSWADALAVMPDGDAVLGGGTTQWGHWVANKTLGPLCTDCPQSMLARFDSSGNLDPGFGSGGLLRLLRPSGSTFVGSIQQVTALPDGRILVNGYLRKNVNRPFRTPFVARLDPDGSYDPSFGKGGLVTLQFPCTEITPEPRRAGCLPSARLALRLPALRRGRPALSLRVAPNLPWATVKQVEIYLPRGVGPTRKLRSRLRMTAVGSPESGGKVQVIKPKKKGGRTALLFDDFGEARELRLKLKRGSLRTFGRHLPHPRWLRLEVEVAFKDTIRGGATFQNLVRRLPVG